MRTSLRVAVAAVVVFLALTVTEAASGHHRLQRSLADAPSVRLHVTLKRKAMQIHGYSDFDVFAHPVVSANTDTVHYDGFATFVEGDTQFKYMFVGGTSYLVKNSANDTLAKQTVRCIQPSASFESVVTALSEAKAISSASIGNVAVQCTGNLLKTSFEGEDFALCASGRSGITAFSSDMTIDVEYLDSPIVISAPTLTNTASPCSTTTVANTSLTPTALSLITGSAIPTTNSRSLQVAEFLQVGFSKCACKSTPRPCIFFHGLGNKNEESELQDSSRHWGTMSDHAPCCTTVKYAALNSVDYGWTDASLQQKFCDHALSMSDSSDVASSTIEDTIIVTHSMGGLVMSGALATGKCSFGESTTWVALSVPMTGSMASDYLQDFCNDEVSSFATGLFEITGQCPMDPSRKSTMYQNEKYASAELNAAYTAAQEAYRGNITTALCSNSYVGVLSEYQAVCIMAGKTVPHKSLINDGLVEFQSCAVGLDTSQFGTSYKDKFYMPQLNHADTSFRTHDALFRNSQKPAKWFECLL